MQNLESSKSFTSTDDGTIRKVKGKYFVFSKTGKKLAGPFNTRKEALKRLGEIEFFKKNKGKDKKDETSKHIKKKKGKDMSGKIDMDKGMALEDVIKRMKDVANDEGNFDVMAQFKARVLFFTKEGGKDNHTHLVILNLKTEDGVTTIDGDPPNNHQIKGGVIQKSAGHTHTISLTETAFPGNMKTLMFPSMF